MNHRSQNHSLLVYSFKYVQPKKIEPETEVNGTEGVEKEKEKEGKAKKNQDWTKANAKQREERIITGVTYYMIRAEALY